MTETDQINRVAPGSPGFPAGETLSELWIRGEAGALAALCRSSVAIVGSRAATAYGEHVAGTLGQKAAQANITVINGGAFGIDGAALRGALAYGGRCVVVLGSGIDCGYPAANRPLFDRVVDNGGLVVSAYPPGTLAARFRFLERNRVIAELARGTVVVEAAPSSGSMQMAEAAMACLKPLMAVPGPLTSAMSAGCHQLIKRTRAEIVDDLDAALARFAPRSDQQR